MESATSQSKLQIWSLGNVSLDYSG